MVQEFDPVRIDKGTGDAVARVPLFYIDDVEYTIPEKVPPGITMAVLSDLADGMPMETCIARGVREIIGRDAMDALAGDPDVTGAQIAAILEIVGTKLAAATEAVMGKSRPAPRR